MRGVRFHAPSQRTAALGHSRRFRRVHATSGYPPKLTVKASRLNTVTYPATLTLTYIYTSLGYAQQTTGPGGQVYWTANERDAEMHLTQQTAGSGVVTNEGFVRLAARAGGGGGASDASAAFPRRWRRHGHCGRRRSGRRQAGRLCRRRPSCGRPRGYQVRHDHCAAVALGDFPEQPLLTP